MSKKWKNVMKKTTVFSFDPKLPRGRAIGRARGTDDIQVGLPAWKKTIQHNNAKTEGTKYLQTEEEIVNEISATIGHEYTHIATGDEVKAERKKAFAMMKDAYESGEDPSKGIEKYITVNFMDEMMARAAHGDMQIEVYLNRGALRMYAPQNIERIFDYAKGIMMSKFGGYEDNKLKQVIEEVVNRTYKELTDKFKAKYLN